MKNRKTVSKKKLYKKLYSSGKGMKHRTSNPNASDYKYYGGKGIKVCSEWLDFDTFKDGAYSVNYEEGLTLDRKDEAKDYCPSNCVGITHSENIIRRNKKQRGRNLNTLSRATAEDVIQLLSTTNLYYREISEITGVHISTVANINRCETGTKLHSFRTNIRKESLN